MKKIVYTLALSTISIIGFAQTGISYGVTLGLSGNDANYAGGDSDAHALFHTGEYGKGKLAFTARYFFNEHWSVQSGLGVSSIGFDFALAKDYSLLKKEDHYTQNNLSVTVLEVPATVIYAFNPTCNNNRWFVGAGLSTLNNFEDVDETLLVKPEGDNVAATSSGLEQHLTADKFMGTSFQFTAGVEKVFEKGGIFQVALLANWGFSTIAQTEVSYTIDNVTYNHSFNNRGDYFGFNFTYYFRPLGGE